jgi:hypothetical protein
MLVGGSVVYVACEGAPGLPARFRALVAHHEGERRRGRLVITTPDEVGPILGQQGAPILRAYLHEKALEMAAAGTPMRLVVIDTFAAAADGDENAVEGTRQALNTLGAIAHELGVAVLALHHERKNASGKKPGGKGSDPNDVRGSGSIVGAVDQVLQLTEEPGLGLVLQVTKARDGAKGSTVGAQILSVVTGHKRRNGDDELAVVVVPRDLQGRQEAEEAEEAARVEAAKQRILEAARGQQEPLSAERLVQAARLTPRITRHLVAPLAQAGELVQVVLGRTMSRYGTPEVVQAWKQRRAGKAAIGTKRDEAPATGDAGDNPSNPAALRPDTSSALRVGRRDEVPLRSTPPGRAEDHELRPDDARDEVGRSGTKGRRRRRRKAQEQEGDA